MNKYGTVKICAKCGYDQFTATYIPNIYAGTLNGESTTIEENDYIEVGCYRCRYTWKEAPLDAEDNKVSVDPKDKGLEPAMNVPPMPPVECARSSIYNEYHEIKDTAIMKNISIEQMPNGGYAIFAKGTLIPPELVKMKAEIINGSIHRSIETSTKEECCERCVMYYKEQVKNNESHKV